jgi:hypothetical protein
MKLTITIEGVDQHELAATLEHEVLRLVEEGYQSGFNSNDTGSYSFEIEGWKGDE